MKKRRKIIAVLLSAVMVFSMPPWESEGGLKGKPGLILLKKRKKKAAWNESEIIPGP